MRAFQEPSDRLLSPDGLRESILRGRWSVNERVAAVRARGLQRREDSTVRITDDLLLNDERKGNSMS